MICFRAGTNRTDISACFISACLINVCNVGEWQYACWMLGWKGAPTCVKNVWQDLSRGGVISACSISACDKGGEWHLLLAFGTYIDFSICVVYHFDFNCVTCCISVNFCGCLISACDGSEHWHIAGACGLKGEEWQFALAFGAMLGCERSIVGYGVATSACGRGEEWQLALAFGWMPGCERSIVGYGAAISACGKGEEWQLALASGSMQGCERSVGAISACGGGEEWQLALAFGWMPGCERSIIGYGAAISACGRGEEWQLVVCFGRNIWQFVFVRLVLVGPISVCEEFGVW